jgi:hypothetical protein
MTTDATPEAFSEQPENLIRMNSEMKGACGFVGWDNGSLYIELYDYSNSAHNAFGNDVATMYRVAAEHLPALTEKIPAESDQIIELATLPQTLSTKFSTIEKLISWINSSKIPYSKTFDSWA